MNIRHIRELAQIGQEKGLRAREVSEKERRIRIECDQKEVVVQETAAAPASPQAAVPEEKQTNVDFNRAREIKSPMVGVFYAAGAPEASPFVEIGSRVKKGDVVCIIEAMKLMNEITAELDGAVLDTCVRNGAVVEYGQPLFKLC